MKIAVIREGKIPPDKRVPLSPAQCKRLVDGHPEVELLVQSSPIRAFKDKEYSDLGLTVTEDISSADVMLGVKEVPLDQLIPDKTYFYFSHTYKEQPYNAKLLRAMLDKKIQMVDYELIKGQNGRRLIGFGRYAGVVGAYNGFRAWGKKMGTFYLKPAHECEDRKEMEGELSKIVLPSDYKMVMSGHGRVGGGALEIVKQLNITEVSPEDLLTKNYDHPVFAHIDSDDYNDRADGSPFERSHFYANPEMYVSAFYRFATVADMYIACHYWNSEAPQILTKEDYAKPDFKLKVISDISCDIEEPIASTLRPSTIADPFYGYHKTKGEECDYTDPNAVMVMAVDNLPCELPKDASEDFGEVMLAKVLPALLGEDPERIIERASETNLDGELMPDFAYLADYAKT